MERGSFDALVAPVLPMLEGYVRRMIGHPEDTRDLVQDTLLSAYAKIETFRGDAKFSTWLLAIATHRCLDHLRAKKRWTFDAQELVRRHLYETIGNEGIRAEYVTAEYRFDAHEHIAFCYSCVGRSLDPLDSAALVLSEIVGLSDRESAHALEVSESVFRHHLANARREMDQRFERLCALVNKEGVCHQCKGLRNQASEERRGAELPELGGSRRLAVVREGELNRGVMQPFHDKLWRALERFAEARGS